MSTIPFENSYAALPERFYASVHPEKAPDAELIRVNEALAEQLGLDIEWLRSADGVDMFAGSRLPESSQPISMAYAGHQFGNFVPQLGDGRAHLIGEIVDRNGTRFDIHLKGSGRTPYSRRGDGKAVLGPVLREYIVSEWFAAMGFPGTRSLAAVTTGEGILRETRLPGAVLARVAQSHVRVGTFQYFASQGDLEGVTTLADYVIDRHFPELKEAENRYLSLFEAVAMRQAKLIAQWMGVGFIHGVMNTDNMQVVGETIDFGPCAFMDRFHPDKVFSSIDAMGRYAWNRQSSIAQWNLARLAEALLPLFDPDQTKAITMAERLLERFREAFEQHYLATFSAKLGLAEGESNETFIKETLAAMAENQVDFTLFFRHLTKVAAGGEEEPLLKLFSNREAATAWLKGWQQRGNVTADVVQRMQAFNPIYIPRNHRIEQVIEQANLGYFTHFHELVDLLTHPFEEQAGFEHYELPPKLHEEVRETFCGT